MLHHHEMDLELGDVDAHEHLHEVGPLVHSGSIGRLKQQFSAAEATDMNHRLGRTITALGYSV